ncbi:MAG: AAA family ATPase, partial [Deltaproteobacteria bacterium]|nr:AAA family ATPase [Deltaproteobacteria bacterium]
PDRLKVLLLNNIVIFPMLAITITARNRNDIELLRECEQNNELIAIATPKPNSSIPLTCEETYPIGTACRVTRVKMNHKSQLEVVLEGLCRISFLRWLKVGSRPLALIAGYPEKSLNVSDSTTQMLRESSLSLLRVCCAAGLPLPESATAMLDKINHPGHLADLIIIYLQPEFSTQVRALSLINPKDRLKLVHQLLYERQRTLNQNEQTNNPDPALWPRPGGAYPGSETGDEELTEIKERIDKLELEPAVRKTINKEFSRLQRMNPASPDYHNIMHYVEYISELPWQSETKENVDLKKAEKILDQDHFGLKEVKERILEHLAVRQLNPNMKGPIICLVGAPGVGKTSLGKSIARAMGRKFIRISLGGVHDEAEIRGHRRTYLGAMPGKILQEIKRAESRNPVFMLDEIDKLGRDFRGDPASALLEVMDPEQNNSFTD